MFVLAHLTDPHLSPLPVPRLGELMGKRALGYLNWRRKRSKVHRIEVLDAIMSDLKARPFNHLAITGDLVNLSLTAEFSRTRAWLERAGAATEVTLVPGNHDRYVRDTADLAQREWAPYMRGDDSGSFPFVRRRGPAALIGLSSALPTAPLMATGRIGAQQLARLETLLAELGREGLFRVVLIHHPPVSEASHYSKRLTDGAELRKVLRKHGAELLVHGHDHVRQLVWLDGPNGPIPAVGAPSASAAVNVAREPAGYHLFEIDGKAGAWRCTWIARGFSDPEKISELERKTLAS